MPTDDCLYSRHLPTYNPVVFPRESSSVGGVHQLNQMPCNTPKKVGHGAGSATVVKHSALTTSSSSAGSSTIMNLVPASELLSFDYFIYHITEIVHVCWFRRWWHWKQPDQHRWSYSLNR